MMLQVLAVLSAAVTAVTATPMHERQLNVPPIYSISQSDLAAFNQSISGRLNRGYPMARPCFPLASPGVAGSVDLGQCNDLQQNYKDDIYIANQFGGYQTANWGACATTGDQCLLDYNLPQNPLAYTTRVCKQGSTPPLYVNVQTPDDVTKSIAFAQKNKIPLVVKNSGHDYKGRSAGPGSLALWTHNLKGITRNQQFVPEGCPASKTYDGVTFAAGTGFAELYQFAEDNNITILGGSSRTVGPSGGWIQGAGHGALSNMLGLGVDRALQFKVVTPKGAFVTANACQNSDLFWALRGGGGSTFGVIMESTTTAAPRFTVQVGYVRFASLDPASSRRFTQLMIDLALNWTTDGWGGYIQPGALTSQASGFVMFSTKLNYTEAVASMKPAIDFANSLPNLPLNAEVATMPSFYQAFNKYLLPNDELVNVPAAVGSRLIPRTNFAPANRAQLLDAMMNGASTVGTNVIGGNPVGGSLAYGGAPFQILVTVPANVKNYPDSAVTPAWRSAIWHVLYAPTTNYDGDLVAIHRTANKAAQYLRDITPGGGAYQNEASILEPDPINTFWGAANYARLVQIKRKYDPNNIFTCWQCVGYNPNDPRFSCYPRA